MSTSSQENGQPATRRTRSSPTNRAKPYTRAAPTSSEESLIGSVAGSPSDAQSPPSPADAELDASFPLLHQRFSGKPLDIPGFPTFDEYKRLEAAYITSLSERKQHKALISQAMFEKIWDVLHDPECHAGSAQFRFWVRKMFVLRYPQTALSGPASRTALTPVVLHDNRPVAIREQLYEVLCYCHALARHGGRDKTCAAIRAHYSWVPKELTAKFVKACPTCTLKRSGNPELFALVRDQVSTRNSASSGEISPVDSEGSVYGLPHFGMGPNDPEYLNHQNENGDLKFPTLSLPGPELLAVANDHVYRMPVHTSSNPDVGSGSDAVPRRPTESFSGLPRLTHTHSAGGYPMMREPALFCGLPNAWHFATDDAEIRRVHYMGMLGDPSGCASSDSSADESSHSFDSSLSGGSAHAHAHEQDAGLILPPLMQALSDSASGRDVGIMRVPPAHVFPETQEPQMQIDPALLMDSPTRAGMSRSPNPNLKLELPAAAYGPGSAHTPSSAGTGTGTPGYASSACTLSGEPSPLTPADERAGTGALQGAKHEFPNGWDAVEASWLDTSFEHGAGMGAALHEAHEQTGGEL